ncbi:uncharacterized protein [Acropora muricata]|uniref:nudix hydrolase 24, chloroplastic-like n=1 Tax=Acropora millepora TaxID=45264 RepID=UPI001CF1DF02|nr:nudix hydrolase 24, chloroplastic-like [Acropora millepora]
MAQWSTAVLRLIQKLNNFLRPGSSKISCQPFLVDGVQVGYISPQISSSLSSYSDVFCMVKSNDGEIVQMTLNPKIKTFLERTERVAEVMMELRQKDAFSTLRGWRDEMYPVMASFDSKPCFMMERSAACLLGVLQYGVHVNGYFTDQSGKVFMWLARRSPSKQTWPSKLDQIVAGGIACGEQIQEALIRECAEEASISEELAKTACPAGSVSYFFEDERGLFPEIQFVYDLKLPETFQPINSDGEVAEFYCWPIDKVKDEIATDDFKPNCALVVLDFLIRNGFVSPDNEPHYVDFVCGLHSTLY